MINEVQRWRAFTKSMLHSFLNELHYSHIENNLSKYLDEINTQNTEGSFSLQLIDNQYVKSVKFLKTP
jgi:hypothetical protein